jgi:hypothetical protein
MTFALCGGDNSAAMDSRLSGTVTPDSAELNSFHQWQQVSSTFLQAGFAATI